MRSHAPFEPIETKFCMWGRVGDVITNAKFYGNRLRGFGVTGLPKRHFLYLTFIALTTALPCCTVMTHAAAHRHTQRYNDGHSRVNTLSPPFTTFTRRK